MANMADMKTVTEMLGIGKVLNPGYVHYYDVRWIDIIAIPPALAFMIDTLETERVNDFETLAGRI